MRGQDFTESLKLAFGTLGAHKFRSMLTVLGVIIGTMTVIAVSSPRRYPLMPDTPSMVETVSGIQLMSWLGLAAPPQTPGVLVMRSVVVAMSLCSVNLSFPMQYTRADALADR